jgi:hypothetical protein
MRQNVVFSLFLALLFSCNTKDEKIPETLFALIDSATTGINFVNTVEESFEQNILNYEYIFNGGGVAIGDINNDGLADVFLTGNQVDDRLFLNKGNWQFEDITSTAFKKERLPVWSTGATMADVNGDGLLDIYVCRSGKYRPQQRENQLFINNGNLTFSERGKDYGVNDRGFSTQALFFDYDLDNDLDLFVLNHNVILFSTQEPDVVRAKRDLFVGDKLYRNDFGEFKEVSEEAGLYGNPLGYGLGVAAGDFNHDGYPDIYVTNDYAEPDYLYMNQGDGTFKETIKTVTQHISNFGMGVDVADIDNDLWPDLYVADMVAEDNYRQKTSMRPMNPEKFYNLVNNGFHYQYMFNSLQLNNQNLTFSEIAQMAGVSNTDWSWATLLVDLDNDGWKDLFVSNGYRKEISNKDFLKYMDHFVDSVKGGTLEERMEAFQKLLSDIPTAKLPNYAFRNRGNLTFEEVSTKWGLGKESFSNGAAIGDLDNDGDLDLVVNNIDEPAFVYRNYERETEKRNYIRINLQGPGDNTFGIGAKVYVETQDKQQYHQHFITRGYQSGMESTMHFGLGKENTADVRVVWPDGKVKELANIKANQVLTITYSADEPSMESEEIKPEPLFRDITEEAGLTYVHKENEFNDFEKEILLPHRMSRFGPAVAVGDINGDGLDDIFFGGAAGFSAELYTQGKGSKFKKSMSNTFYKDKGHEDLGAAFFDADEDGDLDLLVASGGNEFEEGSLLLRDRLYFNDGNGNFIKRAKSFPDVRESSAVVRPYDYDEDGDLDVFIGGRVVPGKYPSPANSRLYRNDNGTFEDVTETLFPDLLNLGLVTDARWSDLDGDEETELIIAGEWMPIKVFAFGGEYFEDITDDLKLNDETGWWYALTVDDLDNDGRPDILGGNLGLNYKYKTSAVEPFQVYYHDFDNSGTGDIVLGYFNEGELFPLRGRQCSSEQMPFIKKKFASYDAFGKANLDEIYGPQLSEALHYTANTFASTIYFNHEDSLKPQQLPNHAQISSINGFVTGDYTGDGIKDILLAGNLYPVEVETTRNDASIGLLLQGKPDHSFEILGVQESGFFAPGDVKHLMPITLDSKKRGILVVRNSGKASLFQWSAPPSSER